MTKLVELTELIALIENRINRIKRMSRDGLRIYVNKDDIPKVLNGIGISILSTSSGLLTDRNARKKGLGGEVLCEVW